MRRLGPTFALLLIACGSAEAPATETAASASDDDQATHADHGMRGGHGMHSAMGGHGHGMRSAMGGHGMHSAMGGGMRGSMGHHGGEGAPSRAQRDDFHALLAEHQRIERQVEHTADGVVTTTTSEDPAVAEVLRRHARSMHEHMKSGGQVHRWDPIFAALADHADAIELSFEDIPGGVRVTGRGTTPEAVALIQAHAEVVSLFVANGHDEAHREHPVPE